MNVNMSEFAKYWSVCHPKFTFSHGYYTAWRDYFIEEDKEKIILSLESRGNFSLVILPDIFIGRV